MILIDSVNHLGMKVMMRRLKDSYFYRINFILYWGMTLLLIVSLFVNLLINGYPGTDYVKYRSFFMLFGIFLTIYLPRVVFTLSVIIQTLRYLSKKTLFKKRNYIVKRNDRRNYTIQKVGLALSMLIGLLVIYGMIWGKSDFTVKRVDVYIKGLPASFEGFKIAQFSDAHLGSFTNSGDVSKGLKLIKLQSPDMIVFTGDMVNNIADEMEPYLSELSALKAPYGKFSILGNHDMSDYVKWKDFKIKKKYIDKLVDYQRRCGFNVLLNSHVIIKKGKDSLALLGVENWGLPPFKKYGDLKAAMQGTENVPVKILLSHDPTHWSEEVAGKESIALTLSGHTHGGQIGFDISKTIRFSPVQFKYKNWSGLYTKGDNKLYVNPGFGYLGYPGRLGIRPQITVIVLHREK